jgi:START domain-containing protein
MKRVYLSVFYFIFFACSSASAQDGWVLKKEKDSIKVYSRNNSQSKFNELKVELTIKATLSEIASLILDIDNYRKWSRNLKVSYVLKQVSDDELYFYTEVNSPWPANNRDLIVHLKIMQDPATKIMTIKAVGVPDFMPPKKDIVRVPFSDETWTVVPIDKSNIRITYYMQVDPGGNAPVWLVNLFAIKAPLESFKYLAMLVQQSKYQQSAVAFIKN